MIRKHITEAESLGYQKPKYKPPVRKLKEFGSKREKWEFMKENKFDGIYLKIKEVFGSVGEPEIYSGFL